MTVAPQRGHLYRCDLGYGLEPWLVVSNNHRNRAMPVCNGTTKAT